MKKQRKKKNSPANADKEIRVSIFNQFCEIFRMEWLWVQSRTIMLACVERVF